jgi:hypothetical protein
LHRISTKFRQNALFQTEDFSGFFPSYLKSLVYATTSLSANSGV